MKTSELETDAPQERPWWRGCALRLVALLCIVGLLWISIVQPYLVAVTQPAPQPTPLLRLSLPGMDIGADAIPAAPGQTGYVTFWLFFPHTDDIWVLPPLPGTPALPEPTPAPRQHEYARKTERCSSCPALLTIRV